VFSAFVMTVRDAWCLVTAGHVLDGIDEDREKGFKLDTFRIWDSWRLDAKHNDWVSFDLDKAHTIRLTHDGLDYGLILLSPYYVNLMRANGIEPVGEESYEKNWPNEFDAYAMIGTAGGTVSLEPIGGRSTRLSQSVYIMELSREPNPPPELVNPTPRFYARILTPEHAPEWQAMGKDIAGMSGGPIIAMRKVDAGFRYWVIGVQSGWLKSARIIAACYFQAFARFVGKKIDESDATNASNE
jgi:hypothetical protein